MFQLFLKVKLKCFDHFQRLIIYAKKLLNSDWLRKECSSPVTLVQITIGSDWLKTQKKPTRTNEIRAVLTTKFKKMAVVFSN